MVYLEIVSTLILLILLFIALMLCYAIAEDNYDPPPMSKEASKMYS